MSDSLPPSSSAKEPAPESSEPNPMASAGTTRSLSDARLRIPSSSATSAAQTTGGSGDADAATAAEEEDAQHGFFYIPNFITEQEEAYLLQQIYDAPALKWKTLQNRSGRTLGRLQTWGGQLAGAGGNTLIPQPLPSFMTAFPNLIQRLADTGAFEGSKHAQPNHCLVNEYLAGQGIMPHEDGGAYFPAVATISLGSHTLLDIYRYASQPQPQPPSSVPTPTATEPSATAQADTARAREKDPAFSIFQERHSLLLTLGSAYREYLHGIAERRIDGPAHLRAIVNLDQLGDGALRAQIADLCTRTEAVGAEAATSSTSEKAATQGADGDDASLTTSTESSSDSPGLARDTRVSLTFRDVEKVSAGLQKLLGRGGGKR